MTLYHYDHCPYCVKVRMLIGLKNIPFETKALPNDDERTPIGLTGKKMVPIIIREDGKPMNESLDILAYLDTLPAYGAPIVGDSRSDLRLQKWLQDARQYHYFLAMPRWIKIGLPEFSTDSAVQYFVAKKTAFMGSFEQRMAETPRLMDQAHAHLAELEKIMGDSEYIWGELTLDDFHLFATLRALTCVRGLKFPPKIDRYMNNLSKKSKVHLHWELAV